MTDELTPSFYAARSGSFVELILLQVRQAFAGMWGKRRTNRPHMPK